MRKKVVRPGTVRLLLCLVVSLTACSTPTESFHRRADKLGFQAILLRGAPYQHAAFIASERASVDTLRVYIEHDGTPWLNGATIAEDPTPRTPFALELMTRDTGPRLLLGRPCYFDLQIDSGCSPLLWTYARYSPAVVGSMVAALQRYRATMGASQVTLIGYSGGGTLAWLMAKEMKEVTAVITIAANLDVELWTSLHGYTPLTDSLNPAALPPLPERIRQIHFVGGRDRNVPPRVPRSFAVRHPSATIIQVPEFDHTCCWVKEWPALLQSAERESYHR